MRKSFVVVAASLVLGVTACGGGDEASGGGSGGGTAELSYAIWNQDQLPVMEQLASEFEKNNPNVTVTVQLTPFAEYFTKLQTSIEGGSAPDVFWLNAPNLALYASNNVVLPLSDRVDEDGVDLGAYPEQLVDLYMHDDTLYALPKDYDTIGLWYNKQLFDAAGVAYPNADWTWENVYDAARRLTNPQQGVHGIAAWLTDQQGYYNTIPQAGGYVVSEDGTKSGYDDPKTIEGLRFWTDLIQQGLSPTHQQMTDTEPKQMFQSGKVAMFYGGSWQAVSFKNTPTIADKIDVAPLPAGPAKDTVVIHGLGNAISADTENPDAAWEFVKFLGSEEAAQVQAETGIVIPAYEGTQEAWVKSAPYNLQIFLDQVPTATPFPVTTNTAEWQALEKQLLPAAWTGQRDVADVAGELATKMNQVLADQ